VSFHIREFNASRQVMYFGKVYALLLVKYEPCGRVRSDLGIVVRHNGPLEAANATGDRRAGASPPAGVRREVRHP
jgi:hypothetical protein